MSKTQSRLGVTIPEPCDCIMNLITIPDGLLISTNCPTSVTNTINWQIRTNVGDGNDWDEGDWEDFLDAEGSLFYDNGIVDQLVRIQYVENGCTKYSNIIDTTSVIFSQIHLISSSPLLAITAGAPIKVPHTSSSISRGSITPSNINSDITIVKDGYYEITYSINFSAENAPNRFEFDVVKNGTAITYSTINTNITNTGTDYPYSVSKTILAQLVSADVIHIQAGIFTGASNIRFTDTVLIVRKIN